MILLSTADAAAGSVITVSMVFLTQSGIIDFQNRSSASESQMPGEEKENINFEKEGPQDGKTRDHFR